MARIRIDDLTPGAELSDEQLSKLSGGATLTAGPTVNWFNPWPIGPIPIPPTPPITIGRDPGIVAAAKWSIGCCNG